MACQEIFALFSPSLQRHRAILIYGPLVRPGNRRHRRGNADMQLTQEGSQTHVCQRLLASYLIYWLYLAAPQGFEPRYADPESAVLPLNEGARRAERTALTPGLAPARVMTVHES